MGDIKERYNSMNKQLFVLTVVFVLFVLFLIPTRQGQALAIGIGITSILVTLVFILIVYRAEKEIYKNKKDVDKEIKKILDITDYMLLKRCEQTGEMRISVDKEVYLVQTGRKKVVNIIKEGQLVYVY